MNKKIYLLTVIHWIGVILLILAFFFGLNYYLSSALEISIPIAVIFGGIILFLVYILCKLKKNKKHVDKAIGAERILLIIYALLAIGSGIFVYHFFTIALEKQEGIQRKASAQIKETNDMFTYYEKHVDDRIDALRDELIARGKSGTEVNDEVDAERLLLLDKSGYSKTLDEKKNYLNKIIIDINQWNWFTIVSSLKTLEEKRIEWKNKLEKQSQFTDLGKEKPFTFSLSSSQSLVSDFVSFSKNGPYLITIFSLLLVHFLILLVYIGVSRNGSGEIKGNKNIRVTVYK